MTGQKLLSVATLAVVKSALSDVFATFATEPVVFKVITVSFSDSDFGEKATPTAVPFSLNVMYAYTTAHDGKYDIIQRTDMGAEEHDGFRLFLWKADMIAVGMPHINPETDHVVFKGKEYDMDFAAPSAQFSDLGDLLWEVEIRYRHRVP